MVWSWLSGASLSAFLFYNVQSKSLIQSAAWCRHLWPARVSNKEREIRWIRRRRVKISAVLLTVRKQHNFFHMVPALIFPRDSCLKKESSQQTGENPLQTTVIVTASGPKVPFTSGQMSFFTTAAANLNLCLDLLHSSDCVSFVLCHPSASSAQLFPLPAVLFQTEGPRSAEKMRWGRPSAADLFPVNRQEAKPVWRVWANRISELSAGGLE